MPETEEEVPGASDELVAALAGGAALTFEPDADEDDLLPGDRVARAEAAVAEPPPKRRPRRSRPSWPARQLRRPKTAGRPPDPAAGRPARAIHRYHTAGVTQGPAGSTNRSTDRHGGHLGGAGQGAA